MSRSIRKQNAATAERADYLLRRHICYEVQMFKETYAQVLRGALNQFDRNMHIECFCIHARNLIEFFKNKDPCDIDPRRFTNSKYEPNGNFIDATLEAKINQQISHLTSKRTHGSQEQLGPEHWKRIKDAIETEIDRFANALTPETAMLWKCGLDEFDFSPRMYFSDPPVATATNHITVEKSKI